MKTATSRLCPQCGTAYGEELRFCPTDGTALRSSSGELVGVVIAERYHVLEMLGQGGMGRVYLAEHVKMGRKCALKVMSPAMMHDADAVGRFNREAANASRINHPNVAAIYDFGETPDGLIYLAMEYIEGEPLTALLDRERALTPERAASIASQIAAALEAAHELGIVHRDLKPDNIMVARGKDATDVVKVVDFGIAKAPGALTQAVTRTGLVVGTPEYMSPEQISGDELDTRSDIYALGLVTFAMLAGDLPFPASTAQEVMLKRITERPRTLADVRPDRVWPTSVQRVLDRALARDRSLRFARATELAAELERAITSASAASAASATTEIIEPVVQRAEPPRRTLVAPPSHRRSRWPRVAVFGVTPVAIVVTLLALSASKREREARNDGPGLGAADSAALAAIVMESGNGGAKTVTPAPALESKVEQAPSEGRKDDMEAEGRRQAGAEQPIDPSVASLASTQPPAMLSPRQTRAALAMSERLIDKGDPERALFVLHGTLDRLPTRGDSVRAIYHVGRAMLRHGQTSRGCDLLRDITNDTDGMPRPTAASLYRTNCQ